MKRNLARLVLGWALWLALWVPLRGVAQLPSCTAARFPDYRDFGCRLRPVASDLKCPPCPDGAVGMPRWSVSQPYQNVWVTDEPLSYPMSHGERMTFRWTHRQRYSVPDAPSYFLNVSGLITSINFSGRDTSSYRDLRTFGATNGAWCQSWLSDIVFWDFKWETNWWMNINTPTPPANYPKFSQGYEAFWFRPDGGALYFNAPTGMADTGSRVRLEPSSGLGYPTLVNPVAGAGGLYWGGEQTNGFRVVYPDGALDIYGLAFALYTGQNSTARAFLTQRIDAQGRVTRIGYDKASVTNVTVQVVFRPVSVVDPDGRTNTIRYEANQRWKVSEIEDPYGRKVQVQYADGPGPSKIIDAQNLTNIFTYYPKVAYPQQLPGGPPYQWITNYFSSGWLSNYTTPYGTTSFEYYDQFEPGYGESFYQKRAARVTEADGSKQLFLYHHKTDTVTPGSVTNLPVVAGWTFDDGATGSTALHPALYHRNSFHWNARQHAALLTLMGNWGTLSSQLQYLEGNAGAHRLSHLQHWLLGNDTITALDLLSSERAPSLDAAGTVEGQWTWYAYGNTTEPELEPYEPLLGCTARLLPDGSTQFQTTDFYNTSGQPLRQRESYTLANGTAGVRTNWLAYAANGLDLTSISNSLGQFQTFAYNTNHQVTSATNTLNQITDLGYYTGTPQLSGINFIGGQTASVTYYSSNAASMNGGFPQTVQWLPGPTWHFGYEKGLVKYATNDLNLRLVFTWDDLLRRTSVVFPDGSYTSNRYDRLDLVATRDHMGNWTTAGYDAMQRPTAITNANNAVTRLDWCGCGALNSITDALTNSTSFYYDNQGRNTNIVFADGSSVKYFFDSANRLTNVLDGLNRSLKLGYNNQGLLTGVDNAYGPLERVVYDAADRAIQITDANNVTVTNAYDLLNRLLTRTWMDGFGETYGWRTNGLVAHTNRNGQVTRFAPDAAGRLTAVTNANLEVTRVTLNTLGQVTDLWDGLNQHTQFGYDEYGRRRSRTDALSRMTTWDYNANGWLTNRTLPQSGNTGYAYDNVGNLLAINYPLSTISYFYNALNQLTNMMDASGTTRFTHTATGQLKSEDGPWDDDTVTLSYTEGLRTAMTVGSTWSQSYGYDSAWRMTGIAAPSGNFSYDFGSQPSTRISQLTLPNYATITNHYDALDRLDHTALKNKWGHTLDGHSYTHDLLGLRTNITRNLGFTMSVVDARYDAISQLTTWSARETNGAPRLNEQFGWNYDAAGNLHYRTNDALLQTFTSDSANQLSGITRVGNLTVTGNTPAPATNITVNGQTTERYGDFTFARTNNALSGTANSFTIIAQSTNGLNFTNAATYNLPASIALAYDANGNLTNDGLRSFAYDAENQLTNVLVTGQWKTEFVYDGLGRRRITRDYGWSGGWVLTNEVRHLYDGLLPIQERDAGNNPLLTYTRGLDLSGSIHGAGGIGGLLARTESNGSAFYHADGSGNITALMDSTGDIAARYLYNPFGKLVGKWGTLADANVMRFSSKPYHPLTEDYDFGFRRYRPDLQRFTTDDPIGERGGINLPRFVHNNPTMRIDPLGLAPGDGSILEQLSALSGDSGNYLDSEEARILNQGSEFMEGLARTFPLSGPAIDLYENASGNNLFHAGQTPKIFELGDPVQDGLFLLADVTLMLPMKFPTRIPCSEMGERLTTVLGSGRDVAPFAGRPGFNVFDPGDALKSEWDALNRRWLSDAISRGDDIWLVTNPAYHERVLTGAGLSPDASALFRVELPMLQESGAIATYMWNTPQTTPYINLLNFDPHLVP